MPDMQPHAPGDGARVPPNGEGPQHPNVRYDESEVRLPGIVGVLVAIALCFGLVGCVAWWFLHAQKTPADRQTGQPAYSTPADKLPPQPRLEPLAAGVGEGSGNVFAGQLEREQQLHSYGSTSENGFVHIPIEEAIQLAAPELPAGRQFPMGSSKSYGLLGGGEPNSGRIYQEAPSWFEPVP